MGTQSKAMLLAATMATLPAAAGAQAPASGLENITVTAQKRSQKTQDIPITITVLDSKKTRQA